MNSKKTWLVANWKMNGNAALVDAYVKGIESILTASTPDCQLVFCPPTPYLFQANQLITKNSPLLLGGQNCHENAKGAHTGEISAQMLADVGASYVIVGHSERRATGETDAHVLAKASAVIDAGLTPIICVGESLAAYTEKRTHEILNAQLLLLATLTPNAYLIAYEPLWAIGSGVTPSGDEINKVHAMIKSVLGSETSVLYGGSVNTENAKEILFLRHVSGALIGGASLTLDSMKNIIAATSS